jgi:hypothetical protein
MRYRLLLLLILTAFYCSAQDSKITKLKISYLDFDMESFFPINCNDFETQFGKEMKHKVIYDNIFLGRLNHYINKMKPDKKRYIPNVRTKLEIYYSNKKVRILCMSELDVQLDGRPMLLDKGLLKLIKKIESQ